MIPLRWLKDFPADEVRPSPNWSARPAAVDAIRLVVIHATADSGNEAGAEEWMCDPASEVSAHLHIRRSGKVVRLVEDRRKAWHAGVSQWRLPTGERVSNLNRISLGWEFANRNDAEEPYTDAQYAVAAELAAYYVAQGLPLECIVGHEDISPNRKTDPGPAWDWRRFRVQTINLLHPPPEPFTLPLPDAA